MYKLKKKILDNINLMIPWYLETSQFYPVEFKKEHFEEVDSSAKTTEEQQAEEIARLNKANKRLHNVIKQLKHENYTILARKHKCNDVCEYVNNLLHKLHKSRAGNKRLNDENIKLRNQQVKTKNEYRVTYPDKLIITPDLIMKEVFDYFNTYMPGSVLQYPLYLGIKIKGMVLVEFKACIAKRANGFYVKKDGSYFSDIFRHPGCTSAEIIRKIEELLEEK